MKEDHRVSVDMAIGEHRPPKIDFVPGCGGFSREAVQMLSQKEYLLVPANFCFCEDFFRRQPPQGF